MNSRNHRYMLTYPFQGISIHETSDKYKGVEKCYRDFKKLNDTDIGLFHVTNLDTGEELHFKSSRYNGKIKCKKISQNGGSLTQPTTNDDKEILNMINGAGSNIDISSGIGYNGINSNQHSIEGNIPRDPRNKLQYDQISLSPVSSVPLYSYNDITNDITIDNNTNQQQFVPNNLTGITRADEAELDDLEGMVNDFVRRGSYSEPLPPAPRQPSINLDVDRVQNLNLGTSRKPMRSLSDSSVDLHDYPYEKPRGYKSSADAIRAAEMAQETHIELDALGTGENNYPYNGPDSWCTIM